MQPKLTKLWIGERVDTEEHTIRADFSNDRHYEVTIRRPADSSMVARALFDLSIMIRKDPHLRLGGA